MMKLRLSTAILGAVLCTAWPVGAAEEAGSPIGRFEIVRFTVEGNTLFSYEETQRLLLPYAGKERDFGYVQRALEALENAYHQRGYSVVQVILPEQELNQGVVRLKVIEARIGKVAVEGNQHFGEENIRASMPALRPGETPNIGEISNSLRMANENPAKKITMQLRSGDQDGEVNAALKVTDRKPWMIGASVDNSGNASTGDHHLSVLYQHANMFDRDHVLSLQYITTAQKPSQVGIYGFGYHIPLYALGDSIDMFGSYSDVNVGTVTAGLINLQVSGKGSQFGARYNQYISRDKEFESKLTYGIDYKAYESNVLLFNNQIGSDVTAHPFSIAYSGNWTLASGEFNYYLSALQNIPGGSKGSSQAFSQVRAGAPAGYKMLRYGANFSHSFVNDWQTRLVLNGQYTRDSLIPGEQFGSAVRGYEEREIANDMGISASAELYTPNLCMGADHGLAQCRFLGFIDGAQVSRNNPLPSEQVRATIGSVGFGVRLAATKYVALQLDYGHALRRASVTPRGGNRLHFRANFSY